MTGTFAGMEQREARSRRLAYTLLLTVTVPLGIAWRLAPLHLPQFAFKYGGSGLWAVAVYFAVGIVAPRRSPGQLAGIAALVAWTVEAGKLIFWPPLDRFRETLAGKLLLGRYFTIGAVVVYGVAIAIVALLDFGFQRGMTPPAEETSRIEHRA